MGLFPYASILHVANLNAARGTYNANTKPSASAVHEFLLEIAGEVDAKLRARGYSLPVAEDAATSARKLLQSVNALGAAWRVELAAETRDEAPFYKELYEDALKMIELSEFDLSMDTGGSSGPRSNFGSELPQFFTATMVL